MTDAEEAQLGAEVSTRIRARYGVVQDQAVHRYVTLVGTALAQASSKPALAWQFIVLDTDAVNAFAAPGGFIHITKGALANLKNESELAGVLGHEIIHVTDKHTIRAIQKGKLVQMGADETRGRQQRADERAGRQGLRGDRERLRPRRRARERREGNRARQRRGLCAHRA